MIGRLLLVLAASLTFGAAGCGGAPPAKQKDFPRPGQCVGGLCLVPQHVIARRPSTTDAHRCLILAWDGDVELDDGRVIPATAPPNPKLANTDQARPGIFIAIEPPNLRTGIPYPISDSPASTMVIAARIDPSVQFADRRLAKAGDVTVIPSGEDLLVIVKTKWEGGREETAQFVVSKAQNGCGSPSAL